MKLFEIKEYILYVSDETWGLLPFKAILKKDKSRNKELAFKEMLFIYYYTDIRSDYLYKVDNKEREIEIIKDIGLPEDWKIDDIVRNAIKYYESMSITPIARLYKSSLKAADDISKYLENADVILAERTTSGGVVTQLSTVTSALKAVPGIMKDLKAAYKEVLAEQKEMEGRTKGSKTMGFFEQGLEFE
jgi:hypothetical protein